MDTDAVLDLLGEVAARIITPRFGALADRDIHEKQPGDLVTIADREAEVEITRALRSAWPDCVVLGEEAAATDRSLIGAFALADHAFTVDPVDGTQNFVHGSPDHAVMVSELRSGVVTRAWIHQPQHGISWVAERGAGIERNGLPWLERMPPADPPRVVTSRWALRDVTLGDWPPAGVTWRCCGIDYPRLVEGVCDVILYSRGHPWDHAPGSLLVEEIGGALAHADGSPYDPRRPGPGVLVVRDAALVEEVVARLPEAFRRRVR